MPYSHDIDRDAGLGFGRCWGEVSIEDAIQASLEMIMDERFEPGFGVVIDLREMLNMPVADFVMQGSEHLVRLRKYLGHRVAVVARGDIATALELASAIVSENGVVMQVFAEIEAARAWASDRSESDEADAP